MTPALLSAVTPPGYMAHDAAHDFHREVASPPKKHEKKPPCACGKAGVRWIAMTSPAVATGTGRLALLVQEGGCAPGSDCIPSCARFPSVAVT